MGLSQLMYHTQFTNVHRQVRTTPSTGMVAVTAALALCDKVRGIREARPNATGRVSFCSVLHPR